MPRPRSALETFTEVLDIHIRRESLRIDLAMLGSINVINVELCQSGSIGC
jgi:hypothetical protein